MSGYALIGVTPICPVCGYIVEVEDAWAMANVHRKKASCRHCGWTGWALTAIPIDTIPGLPKEEP